MTEKMTPPAEAKLESWKAIAAYLNRDARTVMRWEQSEGLPVHRHRHLARSTVYAFPSELDAWQAGRKPEEKSADQARPGARSTRLAAVAAVALMTLLSAGGGRFVTPVVAEAQRAGVTSELVWSVGSLEGRPSPDGRYFAFPNYAGASRGGANVAVRELATGEVRELTRATDNSFAVEPFFSADGSRIVFSWWDRPTDEWSIRIVNIDGTGERTLVQGMFAGAGAVAPDNRTAAVPIRRNGVHQILLIDLDTAATRQLTSLEWRAVEVGNFSPDGRHLVYSVPARADGPDRRIHVIAASGESDRVLVDAPGQHRSPFFSPDGRHVAFVSNRSGGRWDLWRVPVVEGRPSGTLEAISTDIGSVANLGFASDGRLFHQKAVDLQDAYEVDIDQEKRAVGAPARVSDRAVGVSAAPKWSRDGKWLAYIVRRGLSGRYDVGELAVVVRSEDGHERQVSLAPHAAADARFFQWFPDRQSLLFVQYGPRGRRFRQLDLATGRVDTLFEAPQSVLNAVISADGRNIVYPSTDPDDRTLKHLVSRDLSTSTDAVLLSARNMGNGPAAFHGLTLAPDGRRFAYLTRGVNVGNLRGGGPQEVWRPSEGRLWPQAMVWDAEGRAVFVTVVHTGSEDRELWYVGIDGEAHAVGIAMPQLEVTSAHPAGRRLGLTAGTDVVQVWAVSGLFPGSRNAPAP